MTFGIGSGYFPAYISNDKFTAILDSDTPPEMSLWEKIKEFFFSTHQAEAQDCLYRLCHPSAGTTPNDVGALFERLKELAHPGYADNIKNQLGWNYFCIMDNNGNELLSVMFADDYTVTATGCSGTFFADGIARSYLLHPHFPFQRGVL